MPHPSSDLWCVAELAQEAAIITSLLELSWALASYHRAVRRSAPDKRNMTKIGTTLQFLWRLFVISSRALAVALFTVEYGYWLVPIAVGHWGVMSIWIMHQGTRFCDTLQGPSPCEEYLFNMIIGTIYLFCFINVKDEPTRFKYLAYYVIVLAENGSLISLWYAKTSADPIKAALWYHVPAFAGVFGAFFMGIFFMLIYYRFFHPNGRPLWKNEAASCC